MSEQDELAPKEIIIIKRRAPVGADAPKGGVWKIAFADFMTAMMAFFLVMWLISATSESTQQGVANYFNPIKLADARVPRKGVRDPEKVEFREQGWTASGSGGPEESAGGDDEGAGGSEKSEENEESEDAHSRTREQEEALFRDPYAVLSAIAEEAQGRTSLHDMGTAPFMGATADIDRPGQDSFRDPFDPTSWDPSRGAGAAEGVVAAPEPPVDTTATTPPAVAGKTPPPEVAALMDRVLGGDPAPADPAAEQPGEEAPAEEDGDGASPEPGAGGAAPGPADAEQGDEPGDAANERLASEVGAALAEALGGDLSAPRLPEIEVKAGEGGVLISLTDEVDFGMFAIGSAEPRAETIAVMEKIASVLQPMAGDILIRGHTDGRPFRSEDYDNWHLSTARAHMARYMLLRGGLPESRIAAIEGRADRDLKIPADPLAAKNRRIDILLRKQAP